MPATAVEAVGEAISPAPLVVKFAFRIVEPISVAMLFIFLLAMSWMRWPDPLIDFPRDLYIAWRVSLGDRLYDQVASWYGPLAHLLEAAGFRIFGVGMDTVVWMNIGLTLLIILLLRGIFGMLGNRFSKWLCTMIFLMVFLCGHYVDIGNYNFITPYVAQTTYGFFGLLATVWALLRFLKTSWPAWLGVAGWGIGVTYVDKPEPLLAAVGAVGVLGLAQLVRVYRKPDEAGGWRSAIAWGWRAVAWLAGGFLVIWLPVFLIFLLQGGVVYAMRATDWVLYTMVAGSFRTTVANSHIMAGFFGFDSAGKNFLSHLQDGVFLTAVGLALVGLTRAWVQARRYSLWWWLAPVVAVMMAAWLVWLGTNIFLWLEFGRALIFPILVIFAGAMIGCFKAAWQGRMDFARAAALAVVASAALLMLARMILNGRIYHYGFFMTPLAVLLIIHLLVVEGARPEAGQQRINWLLPAIIGGVAICAGLTLMQLSLHRYSMKTLAVGEGRDHFYTFESQPPADNKNFNFWDIYIPRGLLLNTMLQQFKMYAPNAKSVVAFPETAAINYHLRLPTPTAEVEFHPTGLGFVGPAHVLEELKANPPGAIFYYMRDLREYGIPFFGADAGSGRDIAQWTRNNYDLIWVGGAGGTPLTMDGNIVDFLVPRTKNSMPTAEELMKSSKLK